MIYGSIKRSQIQIYRFFRVFNKLMSGLVFFVFVYVGLTYYANEPKIDASVIVLFIGYLISIGVGLFMRLIIVKCPYCWSGKWNTLRGKRYLKKLVQSVREESFNCPLCHEVILISHKH
jgi:hypothetical protein